MSADDIRKVALDKRTTIEARVLAAIKAAEAARNALDALSVVLADIATALYSETSSTHDGRDRKSTRLNSSHRT